MEELPKFLDFGSLGIMGWVLYIILKDIKPAISKLEDTIRENDKGTSDKFISLTRSIEQSARASVILAVSSATATDKAKMEGDKLLSELEHKQ